MKTIEMICIVFFFQYICFLWHLLQTSYGLFMSVGVLTGVILNIVFFQHINALVINYNKNKTYEDFATKIDSAGRFHKQWTTSSFECATQVKSMSGPAATGAEKKSSMKPMLVRYPSRLCTMQCPELRREKVACRSWENFDAQGLLQRLLHFLLEL